MSNKPYQATPDELRAIDDALAEPRHSNKDLAALIAAIIYREAQADPDALARRIIAELDRAGYEIRPKPDLIPIRHNPMLNSPS